jgi:hypothetical protein
MSSGGDFGVGRGADDLDELRTRIKRHADGKAIQRELNAGMRKATAEVRRDMKAAILPSLPSRGGLAASVYRGARMNTSTSRTGVRIKVGKTGGLNEGRLRHPVFGNRKAWVQQTAGINEGFLDEPFEKSKPDLLRAIKRVMDDVARKVEG